MRLFRRRTRGEDSAEPASDLRSEFEALVAREWKRLARPGTWGTGTDRIAIAAEARAALADEPEQGVLSTVSTEAVRKVAGDAASIRADDVDRWHEEGLDGFALVELVGIVSRLIALDVAAFGLGRPEAPLPDPEPGEPSREKPDDAEVTTGWVPTVGPASAPSSLSAVPAEAEAMFDLHGVLYASMDEMFDLQLERNGLRRPQIELVAARTSHLNDCFY